MNTRIRDLVQKIRSLEDELRTALHDQETNVLYQIEGTRVDFENRVRAAHRAVRVALPQWLRESRPRNVVSAPIIYSMIVPLFLLDLSMTIYQRLCFPLYGVPRVARSRYVVIDRHRLHYLNLIEKLNCVYCGYANGVIAYAREITARTEQYWCPIKHARMVLGSHSRYAEFLDFGDPEFGAKLSVLRRALAAEQSEGKQGDTPPPANEPRTRAR